MEERLQKILSGAGVSSRRAAERMIAEGRISVNRTVVVAPGTKADPEKDEIRLDGRLLSLETERIYLLLHKPKGYVTTLSDPQGRPTVAEPSQPTRRTGRLTAIGVTVAVAVAQFVAVSTTV